MNDFIFSLHLTGEKKIDVNIKELQNDYGEKFTVININSISIFVDPFHLDIIMNKINKYKNDHGVNNGKISQV